MGELPCFFRTCYALPLGSALAVVPTASRSHPAQVTYLSTCQPTVGQVTPFEIAVLETQLNALFFINRLIDVRITYLLTYLLTLYLLTYLLTHLLILILTLLYQREKGLHGRRAEHSRASPSMVKHNQT